MYNLIHTLDQAQPLDYSKPIYFDIETIGLYGHPRLMQVYQEGWEKVDIYDTYFVSKDEVWERLKKGHLVGFLLAYEFGTLKETSEKFDDLYFAAKLALPKLDRWTLDLVLEELGITLSTPEKKKMQKADWSRALTSKMLTYAAEDVLYLPKLYHATEETRQSFAYRLDIQSLRYTVELQQRGMPVAKTRLHAKRAELVEKLSELEDRIQINYNSTPQIKELLGTQKADVNALKQRMYAGDKMAEDIYYAKRYSKQLNFIEKYDTPDDRVYGHFNPAGARSGRMSCSEENLQQIPNELKSLFGFETFSSNTLVAVDFPQIELRIAVALWGEPEMEELFKKGEDLHYATASFIYGKPVEEINKKERQVAKSANFGLLYSMGAKRFREYVHTNTGIDLSFEEAAEVRDKWFMKYQGFAAKHREVARAMRSSEQGYYMGETLFGRRYKGDTLSDALNIQIQGTGAELMKLALHYLLRDHPQVEVVNVVHDAIVAQSPVDQAEKIGQWIVDAMEKAWLECCKFFPKVQDLPCPLDVDISKVYGG